MKSIVNICFMRWHNLRAQSSLKIQNTITNLESGESNSGISIYPNPTSNVININYPDSGFTWELRNTDGQLLKTGEEKSIELLNEPSGIYFLKIGNNVFKVSKK